ncbi:MAG: cupin domain-containing protein [Burkholderiales bacterium]|nr:cupin domain-containing protein [Burkholderiales bacterium]
MLIRPPHPGDNDFEEDSPMIRTFSRLLGALALGIAATGPALAAETVNDQDLKWSFVPGFARPIEVAVVSGDPNQPGPFVIRMRMPSGMKIAPQRYPDDRELTILKGIFWSAEGESYNWKEMNEYKAGTVIQKPTGKAYYGWARTAVVLEEKGTGPTKIEYVHEDDDPRNHRRE